MLLYNFPAVRGLHFFTGLRSLKLMKQVSLFLTPSRARGLHRVKTERGQGEAYRSKGRI
jgi:hypothetical protein